MQAGTSSLDATTMQASITGFAFSPRMAVLPTCSTLSAMSRTVRQTYERTRSKIAGHSGLYSRTWTVFMSALRVVAHSTEFMRHRGAVRSSRVRRTSVGRERQRES
jgi:hypothetical protein